METYKCRRCIYRSANMALYACDYFSFTGTTRKAVPAEKCTHFVRGRRGDIAKGSVKLMPENMRTKKVSSEQILELYLKGLSDAAVGKQLGVASQTVGRWRRRNGYPPNGQPGPKPAEQKTRQEVAEELFAPERENGGERYAPQTILAVVSDLRAAASGCDDQRLRYVMRRAADTVENLLRSADAMQAIIARQHERLGTLSEDAMCKGAKIAALQEENQRLHKENFWLTEGQDVVLCRNCRSGGMCQMERNFRSEGIEEPFCCRGKVKG